jgi:hypothetical protein
MGLSTALTISCNETNRASIKRIFLAPTCDITSMTVSGSDMSFTAVTMDSTAVVFYEYEAEFETKDLNGEGAAENGTATFTNTVNFKVLGLDKVKMQNLQDIIDSRKITAVVETANSSGTYNKAFVVGWDSILEKDAYANANVNLVIEAGLDGDNSATVTLTAKHAELVRELVGTIEASTGTVNFGS